MLTLKSIKVLLDLYELKIVERIDDESDDEESKYKWKLSPDHRPSTAFKKKVPTSSKLPPAPLTPSER